MIPVGDSVHARSFPYVNLAIIIANILVFLYELTLSTSAGASLRLSDLDRFFYDWGSVPGCLVDWAGFSPDVPAGALRVACPSSDRVPLTPLTAMFMHGGWFHLAGNMVFLWVFGDNVEDAMGHVRYAVFYVIAGLAATAAHVAINQNDVVPAIGASGAIAGVLAAYLVLYPRATVAALLPIFVLIWIPIHVPAFLLIGLWFVLQLLNSVAALASTDVVGSGGVAWFAHLGGFAAGLVLVRLFVLGRPRRPPVRAARRRGLLGW